MSLSGWRSWGVTNSFMAALEILPAAGASCSSSLPSAAVRGAGGCWGLLGAWCQGGWQLWLEVSGWAELLFPTTVCKIPAGTASASWAWGGTGLAPLGAGNQAVRGGWRLLLASRAVWVCSPAAGAGARPQAVGRGWRSSGGPGREAGPCLGAALPGGAGSRGGGTGGHRLRQTWLVCWKRNLCPRNNQQHPHNAAHHTRCGCAGAKNRR